MENKTAFTLIASIFVLAFTVGSGAFGVSYMRRECAKEARELKRLETEFASVKRENEFWDTQIARSKDLSALRERAGSRLKATDAGKVIYAYKVRDSSGRQRYAASFRQSSGTSTASTAQR